MPSDTGPLRITDLTFRDGQQSLLATRMRTEDMEAVAEDVARAGYYALEIWGGATFDSMHRFLGEDPWERPRRLRALIPKPVKLQMLLRGQNLVGYRNYADDVVRAFVEEACRAGIEIFRVFDALNDLRNLECAAKAVLKTGMHLQGTLSYTVTGGRMGGELFTLEYWVAKARALAGLGCQSLCLKDMAGLLHPDDAAALVPALKKASGLPLELHTHTTSGMAEYAVQRAIAAGLDIVDTCSAPLAGRTSHPAVEPLAATLRGTPRDPGLDLTVLSRVASKLEALMPKYRQFLDTSRVATVDIGALEHQIPGGMLSNLVHQLREQDALDRLQQVFEELPRVRADLGFPPLVTPTSQIVGVQAVQNVLLGKPGTIADRYKMINDQVKDYCYGLYGQAPAAIHPEVRAMALKGYARGETPITERPADLLPPELDKAKSEIGDLAADRRELLIFTLFPTTGKRFLQVRRGLEPAPAEWRPKSLEEAQAAQAPAKTPPAPQAPKPGEGLRPLGPGARTYTVRVDGEIYQVEVAAQGAARVRGPSGPAANAPASGPTTPQPIPAAQASPALAAPAQSSKGAVLAPMPGTLIQYTVKVGDPVKAGAVVAVLEAMKMENRLAAPIDGVVKALNAKVGERVAKQAVLLTIG
jgi:pyruvate carboxylase subunit B